MLNLAFLFTFFANEQLESEFFRETEDTIVEMGLQTRIRSENFRFRINTTLKTLIA